MSEQSKRGNVPVWFEIPAVEWSRAIRFYETVFAVQLTTATMGGMQLAVFPYRNESGTTGCLAAGPHLKPSADGPIVYLNADPSLDAVLSRVAEAGGTLVVPRTELLGDMGCFACFLDSEGNRVGIHALA
jgi:predicted enzyme related to lactoylglutathione lyase